MSLSIFDFEGNQVRFVGTSEHPEWIAKDVCICLGLENVSHALASLEEPDKGIINCDTPSGEQAILNRFVRDYALNKTLSFGYVYSWVYREFRDRYHVDLTMRGKNHKLS